MEPIELIFHEVHDHQVCISDLWMREVERRSGGAVKFTRYTGAELPAGYMPDASRDVPAHGGVYHLLDLIQMPFLTESSVQGSRMVAQLYEEFPEFRNELSDVKMAGLGTGSVIAIFSSRQWGPVKRIEDLIGARIRSLASIDAGLSAVGAKPVYVPYLSIKEQMETGALDAAVLGLLPAMTFDIAKAAPYCTIAKDRMITTHPMRLSLPWESFNKLPHAAQKAVDELGPAGSNSWFATHCGPDFDAHVETAIDYIRKNGEIVTLNEEELIRFKTAMQPSVDEALRAAEEHGLPGKAFYHRLLELSKS